MKPPRAVLDAMADRLHRRSCWRGPSCSDFTSEDVNNATALWWLLRGLG